MDSLFMEIVNKAKAGFFLTINEHKSYYESIDDYFQRFPHKLEDTPPETMDKIIETNNLVELQVYDKTPVGFLYVAHYDLDLAIQEMADILGINRD